jgi:hypothetical protein
MVVRKKKKELVWPVRYPSVIPEILKCQTLKAVQTAKACSGWRAWSAPVGLALVC